MVEREDRELEQFRQEVRDLIRTHAPRIRARAGFRSPETAEEDRTWRQWRTTLYDAQMLGAEWPAEWGGLEIDDPERDMIFSEEIARAGLPPFSDQTHLAAFALLQFGTHEQKSTLLRPIRRGEHVWCQLFSEPNAGSDLAAMQTRARSAADDSFIIDGQKVWSSNAQWAQYGFLLARTGSELERHRGLSAFALDMSLPGIDVRPLREITGTSDFNEVFLNSVQVPRSALIGEVGDGWRIAMASLAAERSGIGAGAARLRQLIDSLFELARHISGDHALVDVDGMVKERIGDYVAQVEVCNLLVHARMERDRLNQGTPADVPVGKLIYSELNLSLIDFALSLLGSASMLVEGDADAFADGRWQDEFLYARTYTIAGGSSEIMRNVLAERVLGLPREAPAPSPS